MKILLTYVITFVNHGNIYPVVDFSRICDRKSRGEDMRYIPDIFSNDINNSCNYLNICLVILLQYINKLQFYTICHKSVKHT